MGGKCQKRGGKTLTFIWSKIAFACPNSGDLCFEGKEVWGGRQQPAEAARGGSAEDCSLAGHSGHLTVPCPSSPAHGHHTERGDPRVPA